MDLRSIRHSSPLSRPKPDPILSNSLSARDCPLHWSSYSGAAWHEDMPTQSGVQDLAPEAWYSRACQYPTADAFSRHVLLYNRLTPVTLSSLGLTHGRQRLVTQPEPPTTKEHTLEVHIKLRSVILSVPWKEPRASGMVRTGVCLWSAGATSTQDSAESAGSEEGKSSTALDRNRQVIS